MADSAVNQHKKLAMGTKPAKGAGQGASPAYAQGGKVPATKKAAGGAVKKPNCNY